jgi:hypothetical protein
MANSFEFLTDTSFTLDAAILLAEASHAAYGTDITPEAWSPAQGFTTCIPFNRSNVQGFWCVGGDVALLAFRGTSNTGQWLRDARFLPSSHPWGWVHAGFNDGISDVGLDIALFEAEAKKAKHVWITGHSLGGALALVAAARLKMNGIPSRLYTYGQPRVGFSGFADRFALELPGALYRFVNQSDIVTRVPPGFLYSHTGTVKRIVRPGVLQTETVAATAAVSALDATGQQSMRVAAGMAAMESAAAVAASGITEPTIIESELPPLSEEQFAALQLALASGTAPQVEGGAGLEMAQLEGALPFIANHAITEYIRLLIEIRG